VRLTIPGTVEDRKAEIVEKKHGYHQAVFEGAAEEPEDLSQDDYLYVLTGEQRS